MGSQTAFNDGSFASASVSVDFEAWDVPDACPHCPTWRVERAVDVVGVPISREWHQPTFPTAVEWAEDVRAVCEIAAPIGPVAT